jgi:hypothetical protein
MADHRPEIEIAHAVIERFGEARVAKAAKHRPEVRNFAGRRAVVSPTVVEICHEF